MKPDTIGLGEPLLIGACDAARLLALSPRTLWALTASGAVPAVRIGRSIRYSIDDLRAFVDSRKAKGAAR